MGTIVSVALYYSWFMCKFAAFFRQARNLVFAVGTTQGKLKLMREFGGFLQRKAKIDEFDWFSPKSHCLFCQASSLSALICIARLSVIFAFQPLARTYAIIPGGCDSPSNS